MFGVLHRVMDALGFTLLSPWATLTLFPAVPTSHVHHNLMHAGRQTIKHSLGNQQVTILLRNKMLLLSFNIIIIFFILISNLELLKNRKILGRKLKLTYFSNFRCLCIDNRMEDAKQWPYFYVNNGWPLFKKISLQRIAHANYSSLHEDFQNVVAFLYYYNFFCFLFLF